MISTESFMKIARISVLVLGWFLIALNIAAFIFRSPLTYYNRIKGEFDDPKMDGLAYWLGTIPFFITGFVFLLIAFLIKKRLQRPRQKPLLDTLLENENKSEIKDSNY
jgi:hypothetical protein